MDRQAASCTTFGSVIVETVVELARWPGVSVPFAEAESAVGGATAQRDLDVMVAKRLT